jgi:hypothetical protein
MQHRAPSQGGKSKSKSKGKGQQQQMVNRQTNQRDVETLTRAREIF